MGKFGVKERIATAVLALATYGGEVQAQNSIPIAPDPGVREVMCRMFADEEVAGFMQRGARLKITPPQSAVENLYGYTYDHCIALGQEAQLEAEKRAACTKRGQLVRDYMLQLLEDTGQILALQSRRSPLAHALGHTLDRQASGWPYEIEEAVKVRCLRTGK